MKVVILCGGRGTRIRDVSEALPKPMIPLGGQPILWHIMKYYAHFGFDQFVLCLGYKGDAIRDYFLNYDLRTKDFTITVGQEKKVEFHSPYLGLPWRITLAETGQETMTGGRIQKIRKYLEGEDTFLLTYGDGVSNVDLGKLVQYHKEKGSLLTVTGVRPPGRFGEISADASGSVTAFNEKPQTAGGRISGGFFVCDKKIFNYLDDRDDLVFEGDPINKLVQDKSMGMFPHDGFWQPMDTYRDYSYLNSLVDKKCAPWIVWDK